MNFTRSVTRMLFATAFSIGLLFMAVGAVSAHTNGSAYPTIPSHAKVDDAIPKIGSTITTAPTMVTVFTVENIKPGSQFSNLFVYGPSGALISQGNAKVNLNNPKEMSIAIKPEKDGVYVVRWITVSDDDGDPDQGAFVFTVNSQASAVHPPAKQTPPPAPSPSGTPLWVSIVVGLIALLVGLGAGIGFGSRRSSLGTAATANRAAPEPEETPTPRS